VISWIIKPHFNSFFQIRVWIVFTSNIQYFYACHIVSRWCFRYLLLLSIPCGVFVVASQKDRIWKKKVDGAVTVSLLNMGQRINYIFNLISLKCINRLKIQHTKLVSYLSHSKLKTKRKYFYCILHKNLEYYEWIIISTDFLSDHGIIIKHNYNNIPSSLPLTHIPHTYHCLLWYPTENSPRGHNNYYSKQGKVDHLTLTTWKRIHTSVSSKPFVYFKGTNSINRLSQSVFGTPSPN